MPTSSNPVLTARSQLALAVREKAPQRRIAELRQKLIGAKVERTVRAALADEHPPTAEQRRLIADLLVGGDQR